MKLLKSTREQIARNLVNHAFKADYVALCSAAELKVEEIYNNTFDEKTRNLMNSLPKDFLPTVDRICVYNSELSATFYIHFNGKIIIARYHSQTTIDEYLWKNINSPDVKKRKPHDCQLDYSGEANEVIQCYVEMSENYFKTYSATFAALSGFRTHEQLLNGWPEVAPFIPVDELPPTSQAVGFPVGQMNAMLKLPVLEG